MTIQAITGRAAAAVLCAGVAGCTLDRSHQTALGRRVDVSAALANAETRPFQAGAIQLGAGDEHGLMLYKEYLARGQPAAPASAGVVVQEPDEPVDPAE
jgi:hypothetical protein